MDFLEENRVKFFLALNGQNREKIAVPLRAKGWKAFPFFVIDPYDRSSFPSLDAGLILGSPLLTCFKDLISDSVRLLTEGKFIALSNCSSSVTS